MQQNAVHIYAQHKAVKKRSQAPGKTHAANSAQNTEYRVNKHKKTFEFREFIFNTI